MTTFIDFHALHTLAPSNVNRGEDGAPKTATFGGVRRQRISSQALKAAQRRGFAQYFDSSELGVRTKRVVELVARRMLQLDDSLEESEALARSEAAFKKAKIKLVKPKAKKGEEAKAATADYLMFLGRHQVDRLAQALVDAGEQGLKSRADAQNLLDTEHAIDVALFGRMVANNATLNVDAAVQVAHALGVHAAAPDFDFYTAVDDLQRQDEETGAGMIGTVEMMSSTFYRYATINVDQLIQNLGSVEAAVRSVQAFATTFVETLPTGKQNTFASHTLPEVVAVAVRDRRPVSYVNAFERAIEASEGEDRRFLAAQSMAAEAVSVSDTYGLSPKVALVMAIPSLREAVDPLGRGVSRDEFAAELQRVVEESAAGLQVEA
ncbi:MAG: type I-E CRISPR-associated protein Cas7/Cse4/CasC [Kocuria sp.]|nr:type I-E CRISPR-associated protein Cas7/Cse4/CasC [Kocuria sp.]